MGQSLVKNYIHIVFSTKHRMPLIKPDIESRIHSYLGGICNHYESPPIIVGGYVDHVHILCMLSKKIALIEFVKELKSKSSKWVKTIGQDLNSFYWQDGYGAFSESIKAKERLINYIKNQEEHHKKQTFKEELLFFLNKYQVTYDERFLWD